MLEKFEGYIKRKKRQLNPKIISIIFFCVFGLTLVFGMDMVIKYKKQKDAVQNTYNENMYAMIGYIKNINIQMEKLKISSGNKIIVTTLADLWRQSNLAKENLATLPVNQESMQATSKYLAQLSDYSYYLIEKIMSNKELDDTDYNNINMFAAYATKLFNITSNIFNELNSGRIKWDDVEKIASEELAKESDIEIYSMSKTFQDYAGLIYDGAFSEHILDIKPQMLKGEIVSQEDAQNSLKSILGEENIESIEYLGEIINNLELYNFKVKLKDEQVEKNIYVTKDTGLIYLIISDKTVAEVNITERKAEELGKEFLEKMGITNMESTYYYIQDNMITINYAYVENNTIFYPDLIKVKIALDDGKVYSLESAGYIYNHKIREIPKEKYSFDDITSAINNNLKVNNIRLAIIPTDAKEEIFTYEINAEYNDKNYLIYLNVENLLEEEILIIIDTPNGSLTM